MHASRLDTDRRPRLGSAAAVVLIHLALGYALLRGLNVDIPATVDQGLQVFALSEPPLPPTAPAPRPKKAAPRREGAASPPNLTAKATPVVAPTPVIPPPVPPPIVAAPVAGIGAQDRAGAAPVRGPGSGSGGIGNGTGSGGSGDGPGGGGGTPLRLIRDSITDRDYPKAAYRAHASGTVGLLFTVGVKGRVTQCTVTRSSGNADLDNGTCRLIIAKLRYEPSRDAAGRPYPDTVEGEHEWHLHRGPEIDDDE